jgi:hypothetical protein
MDELFELMNKITKIVKSFFPTLFCGMYKKTLKKNNLLNRLSKPSLYLAAEYLQKSMSILLQRSLILATKLPVEVGQ